MGWLWAELGMGLTWTGHGLGMGMSWAQHGHGLGMCWPLGWAVLVLGCGGVWALLNWALDCPVKPLYWTGLEISLQPLYQSDMEAPIYPL